MMAEIKQDGEKAYAVQQLLSITPFVGLPGALNSGLLTLAYVRQHRCSLVDVQIWMPYSN